MKADELTAMWCFGEGSLCWRMGFINEFSPLVDDVDKDVRIRDGLWARVVRQVTRPMIAVGDGLALTLVDIFIRMLEAVSNNRQLSRFHRFPIGTMKERDDLALRLARLAIDFVVLHEICHVARGHMAFCWPPEAATGFTEFCVEPDIRDSDPCIDPVLRRSLEIDADICALFLWEILNKPMASYVKRYQFPDSRSRDHVFRLVLDVVFLLMGSHAAASHGLENGADVAAYEQKVLTHPHPLIRRRVLEAYAPGSIERPRRASDTWTCRRYALSLRRTSGLLEACGQRPPAIPMDTHADQYIVDRANAIVDRRTDTWPTFTLNSRWEHVTKLIEKASRQ